MIITNKNEYNLETMNKFDLEFWKEEIESYVDNVAKNSGYQNSIDSETMQNIVNELMQDKKTFECIDWLNILIYNACNRNGITL